jgi:GxxExxY protein
MNENLLSKIVFETGMKIHRKIGPGLLESVYEECLYYELTKRGLNVQRQLALPLIYDNITISTGYRLDLIVEDKLIIELKTVESLTDLHMAQLLTYLKLSNCKIGLLINFNTTLFKDGIQRVINGYISERTINEPRYVVT